jgi:uncharacterized membrane protein YkvA (DUF1232 family)
MGTVPIGKLVIMNVFTKLEEAARRIKFDAMTIYFSARDPRTPFFVRLLALAVAAYAFSPIDLIPDFIPILGYLDDIILLPLGIFLIIKLTPASIIETSRTKAMATSAKPKSNLAAAAIIVIWILGAVVFGYWMLGALNRRS